MRFSVILATFNRAPILRLALNALSAQTYPDFEAVVVDDGSTDETPTVAKSYPFVRYLAVPHQAGVQLFNLGWRNATGDIIVMGDDDYVSPPHLLASLADAFRRYPEVAAVGCYAIPPDNLLPTNRFARYDVWEWGFHGGRLEEYVGGTETPTAGAVAYKKWILEQVGGFNEALLITGAHDHDMKQRLVAHGYKLAYLPIKIDHVKTFTESSFIQQHIGRGRAAARYEQVVEGKGPTHLRVIFRALKRGVILFSNLATMSDKALAWTIFQAGWADCIGEWQQVSAQLRRVKP